MRTLLIVLLALVATATPASAATPLEAGTQLTLNQNSRCVNGFNVRGYLLVSVHCANANGTLIGPGGVVIGPVERKRATYGVVRILDPSAWDQLPRLAGHPTPITGSVEAAVGATVCTSSRISGWRCGTVVAKNQSISHGTGTITGLTRTNLCVQPGDDWLPVISGSHAQGHLMGGSTGGCTSFFYPINRILAAEGFTLVTA
ncbi:S1 family peptidase [Actinosynnema sp. CS-041913]|uniref:S1 family peptidase n=1 Tax=Actinosynnema sp. CS-041913 TaxID=3239917 RepID=UPI003D8F334D